MVSVTVKVTSACFRQPSTDSEPVGLRYDLFYALAMAFQRITLLQLSTFVLVL